MSTNLKYKIYGTLFLTLLSFYLLAPSLAGLKEKRDAFKSEGKSAPWYFSLLPDKELNLGLDLRGGLYLELEIGLADALAHQVGFLAADIRRYVAKGDLEGLVVENVDNRHIRVEIPADKKSAFTSALVNSFGNQVVTVTNESPEIFFAIKSDPETARKAALETLKTIANHTGEVATTHGKKYLAVGFSTPEQKAEILSKFSQPEMTPLLEAAPAADALYVRVSDEYFAKLKRDVVEQAANAVRNRIDRYGVAEASVSRQSGDRLVVELPGAKNPDDLISIIRRTGKLEFRLVDESLDQGLLRQKVDAKLEELKLDKPYEGEALAKLNAALKSELPENTEILFTLQRDPATKAVTRFSPQLITKNADVTGDMLENAKVETQHNQPYVSMSFNKTGAKKFGELTEKNVGRQLAIVLDSVVMSAPVIRTAIMGGEAQIELGMGRFDALMKEAQDLVLVLREGALPASLAIASKNIIGPSLGHDSIEAGLKSVAIASLLVMLFMMAYYRTGGIIANLALILNVLFLFAILCLFQASVSLPGLAGIALTIGMAVDANVIIFERMREERFLGHDLKQIIASGYDNAMSAIVDGNITTFIAGLVLFEAGSGPIKGFATTLMIGIVTTMFSAIVVTRTAFDWLVESRKVAKLSF